MCIEEAGGFAGHRRSFLLNELLLFEPVEPCEQDDERGGGKREAEPGGEQSLNVHVRGDIHYAALDVRAKA